MTNKKSRTLNVVEDPDNPGELLWDLGNDLCAQLGWQAGDTVEWTYDLPHMAANIGLEPRYTLQITGHL